MTKARLGLPPFTILIAESLYHLRVIVMLLSFIALFSDVVFQFTCVVVIACATQYFDPQLMDPGPIIPRNKLPLPQWRAPAFKIQAGAAACAGLGIVLPAA